MSLLGNDMTLAASFSLVSGLLLCEDNGNGEGSVGANGEFVLIDCG